MSSLARPLRDCTSEKTMRRFLPWLLALALLLALYLLLWPVPIRAVAWRAPRFAGYIGPHVRNERLAAARSVSIGPEIGPEHITFGRDGKLYTGTLSGAILRMNPDGSEVEQVVNTGGRPLGMEFDADGRLIVADAFLGLLAVGTDRSVTVLVDHVGADPIAFADAVAVASDGRIFFTDATQRLSARRWGTFDAALLDIMEHSCTGRVLEFRPPTRALRVVIGGLCFANGVVLSADESQLYISETGEYRIWRVAANADGLDARALSNGPADLLAREFASNLPGFPDNVTRGPSGRIWVGFTKPRSAIVDALSGQPWLRAMSLRLPRALWPVPPAYGHVVAFDESGRVIADLQDPAGRILETSGVTEHEGQLYIQSLHASALGILPVSTLGP
jgi:sugar lactone lactonase YvrE